MKFTLDWLKEHLDTTESLSAIADKLTMIGLEVEKIEDKAKLLAPFTIARVIEAKQHPNADRLRVCMVDAGDGKPVQVVCGAPNARTGMIGVFSPPGTYIPGKDITLGVGTIRGVESRGMLVSEAELLISDDHDGIIDLPADAPVGSSYAKYAGLDEAVIEINLTPNRADCTGVNGIARDLGAADIGKFKENTPKPVKGTFPCPVTVTLDFGATPSLCPAFGLRLVKGVKNGPSPEWLQKRLTAIGLRPINALVDITNLITFDRGRPLHVFDAAKVHGNLTVRRGKKGESLLALDGKTYELDDTICVIADEKGIELLAGIMGGEARGCSETTTDVLIESALWDPLNIAQTGRKLGIHSDARYRFERGVDPNFMLPGLELATELVIKLCGGTAVGNHRRRRSQIARQADRISGRRSEASRRARSAAARDEAHPRKARLLRRRHRQDREGRGAVLAAGCRRQSRYRRGSRAHRGRRSRALDRIPARRRAAQARSHLRASSPAQSQARAGDARPGRGRHLVVHLQAAGRIVRRRRAGARAGQSDRGRPLRHAAEPHSRPRHRRAEKCRSRVSRCRAVRSRAGFQGRQSAGSTHRRLGRAARIVEDRRRRTALADGGPRAPMCSTPRPTRWPRSRPPARRCRRCRSCRAARPGFIPAAAARSKLARRISLAISANCIRAR